MLLRTLLLGIPLGGAEFFDGKAGSEPVLVHREEDPDGPWFWVGPDPVVGDPMSLDEVIALLE